MRYTQKQIDKYLRQKYIVEIEKIAKNLFRMFRDSNVTYDKFKEKFISLKKSFDSKGDIRLDSEYHHEMKSYINILYNEYVLCERFTDKEFDNIRDAQMSNLNRLQKLKNKSIYKKDKHKSQSKNEDWG